MPSIGKRKSVWIVFACFLVVAWASHTAYRAFTPTPESNGAPLQEGALLPADLPLEKVDGGSVSLADYRGKVVLLNFWAAWCAPCLKEMPSLNQMQARIGTEKLQVLAVSMDEDPRQAVLDLNRLTGAVTFPIFRGYEQPVFDRFPIEGLPFTVIADQNGVIRHLISGERDWLLPEGAGLVEALL